MGRFVGGDEGNVADDGCGKLKLQMRAQPSESSNGRRVGRGEECHGPQAKAGTRAEYITARFPYLPQSIGCSRLQQSNGWSLLLAHHTSTLSPSLRLWRCRSLSLVSLSVPVGGCPCVLPSTAHCGSRRNTRSPSCSSRAADAVKWDLSPRLISSRFPGSWSRSRVTVSTNSVDASLRTIPRCRVCVSILPLSGCQSSGRASTWSRITLPTKSTENARMP